MPVTNCPDCGGIVSDRLDYCPHCGAPMRDDVPVPSAPSRSPESHRGGGCMRGFLISFFLVLLLGSAGAGWYWYNYLYEPEVVVVTESLRNAANSYDRLGEFYDGVAQAWKGDEPSYIDTKGEVVDSPASAHDGRGAFHTPDETGLLRIEKDGRWGMIDRETRDTVIRPVYTTLGSFYNGLALATLKFGDKSMPEYLCFYGYVDTKGHHTFTPEHFQRIEQARHRAERREYIESLPHGITARSLGLPEGVKEAVILLDSLGKVTMRFARDGVLTYYDNGDGRRYGVSGGFVTSLSMKTQSGVIRTFRFLREKVDELHEAIIRQGADGRARVGQVTYSPDDGTVTSVSFENIGNLSGKSTDLTFY